MKFYHVMDGYIAFLRQYDSKVADNKKGTRPYVGVVLIIDGAKYYAPFSSPKPKHRFMKNGKDFRKIGDGRYGAINLNNMIPVPDAALIPINIPREPDPKYRRLLQNQYLYVQADWEAIEKAGKELYKLILSDDSGVTEHDRHVKARCCNLMLLKSVFNGWNGGTVYNPYITVRQDF